MKITLLLIFCSLFQLKADILAQQKVSIQMKEVTLDKVFKEMSRQVKCSFLFNYNMVRQKGRITVDARNQELSRLLDELLPGLGMEYVLDMRMSLL